MSEVCPPAGGRQEPMRVSQWGQESESVGAGELISGGSGGKRVKRPHTLVAVSALTSVKTASASV